MKLGVVQFENLTCSKDFIMKTSTTIATNSKSLVDPSQFLPQPLFFLFEIVSKSEEYLRNGGGN